MEKVEICQAAYHSVVGLGQNPAVATGYFRLTVAPATAVPGPDRSLRFLQTIVSARFVVLRPLSQTVPRNHACDLCLQAVAS